MYVLFAVMDLIKENPMLFKIHFILAVFVFWVAAFPAQAWSLFGSKESNAKDLAGKSDRKMERADTAFDDGKLEDAKKYYEEAVKGYEKVESLVPGFNDGLPEIRIRYCSAQLTNVVAAISAIAATNAPAASVAEKPVADKTASGSGKEKDAAEAFGSDGWSSGVEYVDQDGNYVESAAAKTVVEKPVYDKRNFVHDFNEAKELLEDGNLNQAFEILKVLLEADPGNRSVRLMIAILRTRQGRYDEALTALEDLRGRREDLPVLLAISGAYIGKGRYMDALLALDNAEKIAPKDPSVSMNLAWLYLVMPDDDNSAIKKATAYYRLAIKKGAVRDRALEARINLVKW